MEPAMKICKLIQVPLYEDDDRLNMDAVTFSLKGFPLAEEAIGQLLNVGFEVKQMLFHGDNLYVYLEQDQ